MNDSKIVSIVLHLYQPSVQTSSVFKQIYESSYYPLLKILKNNKNAKITLNIPLSLLELMDTYGYDFWIRDIAKLHKDCKIEVVGSAAYHVLLSEFSDKVAEDQIILNEYGLGYYFGKKTGFEGEKAVTIPNLVGFFPPELAVNNKTLHQLIKLNYEWTLVDSCAISEYKSCFVRYNDSINLVIRNTQLSNFLAFYRGFDANDVHKLILDTNENSIVIALDGETFGHHNKDGILLFDSLIDKLSETCILATVSENLRSSKITDNINTVNSSSWGASIDEVLNGNFLPFWKVSTNNIHTHIWNIYNHVSEVYANLVPPKDVVSNLENVAIWKPEIINGIEDDSVKTYLLKKISYMRLIASDFAWWGSNHNLYNGDNVYDPNFVKVFVEFSNTVADMTNDAKLKELNAALINLL